MLIGGLLGCPKCLLCKINSPPQGSCLVDSLLKLLLRDAVGHDASAGLWGGMKVV